MRSGPGSRSEGSYPAAQSMSAVLHQEAENGIAGPRGAGICDTHEQVTGAQKPVRWAPRALS